VALPAQALEAFENARVHLVLEHPRLLEALPIEPHRAVHEGGVARLQQLGEGLMQRRADETPQRRRRGCRPPEARERVLEAARDARPGIGERAVEVEEDVHFVSST